MTPLKRTLDMTAGASLKSISGMVKSATTGKKPSPNFRDLKLLVCLEQNDF